MSSSSFSEAGDSDSSADDEAMASPGCQEDAGDSGSQTDDSDSDTDESMPLCASSEYDSGPEAGDDDSHTDSEAVDGDDSGSEAGDVKSTAFGKTRSTASSASSSHDANADDAALSSEGSDMSVWEDHIRQHGPGHRCPRCIFNRNKNKWKRMFAFETSSGSLASWLEERSGVCRGGWAIGCRACRLAGFRDLWGRARISGGTVGVGL